MKHPLFSLTLFTLLISNYLTAISGERVPEWKIFESAPKPSFKVSTDKYEYIYGEAIAVRFILQNENSTKTLVHERALRYQSSSATAGVFLKKISHIYEEPCLSLSLCGWEGGVFGAPVNLEAGEKILGDYILGSMIRENANKYYVRASYYWRSCNPKYPSTEIGNCQFIYAEPVEIKVIAPEGEEAEAFKYLKNNQLLTMLQTPFYSCTLACAGANDVPCEDTPEFYIAQGRKFLERFPKSAYSRYMNFTLGMILKDQKNFRASEEQMGKFIALYPDDWMVDDAMFEMAVCQIEQGKPDKAQATLESLLQKFPLTSAYQAKRVLENLKKGYKTMDQVYSH